jgi:hypothetical protein
VLLSQRVVLLVVRVLMAGLVMSSFNSAQSALESRSPTTLTLVSAVKAEKTEKYGTFTQVGAETAPERVPLARFVIRTGDLQEPVPDCNHDAP